MDAMIINRVWAMPTHDTFDCAPMGELVKRYLVGVSIDPFARNKRWATYTNDLNPGTEAEYHMDAADFMEKMVNDGVSADVIIFDPPYSPRQMKEMYESFGLKLTMQDTQRPGRWSRERAAADRILKHNGHVLHFGWNTAGMGETNGYIPVEILIVTHGAGHQDTLCLVEKKVATQLELA
jgi:hypothetical protein